MILPFCVGGAPDTHQSIELFLCLKSCLRNASPESDYLDLNHSSKGVEEVLNLSSFFIFLQIWNTYSVYVSG